jgi:hypothetical protein
MKLILPLLIIWSVLSSFGKSSKDYYAQLGSIKDGTASVNEILLDPVLRVFKGEMIRVHQPALISFTMSSSRDIQNILTGERNGELTRQQLDMIKRSRVGEIIYIEEIILECGSAYSFNSVSTTSRKLPPTQIKIIH